MGVLETHETTSAANRSSLLFDTGESPAASSLCCMREPVVQTHAYLFFLLMIASTPGAGDLRVA